MKKKVLLSLAAVAIFGAVQIHAQDIPAGEAIYKNSCNNCHGPTWQGVKIVLITIADTAQIKWTA